MNRRDSRVEDSAYPANMYLNSWLAEVRPAAVVRACDETAVRNLRAAFEGSAGAAAIAAPPAAPAVPARFSASQIARARTTAQKQLKFDVPDSTCSYCEYAAKDTPLEPSDVGPAPAFTARPSSAAEAFALWESANRYCHDDPRSLALGEYAQRPRECTMHWRVRTRTDCVLRRFNISRVESRRTGNDTRAAIALIMEEFGCLPPEFFVKGSPEAAAAGVRFLAFAGANASNARSSSAGKSARETTTARGKAAESADVELEAADLSHAEVASASVTTSSATEAPLPASGAPLLAPAPPPPSKVQVKKSAASKGLNPSEARAVAVKDFLAYVKDRAREGIVVGAARHASSAASAADVAAPSAALPGGAAASAAAADAPAAAAAPAAASAASGFAAAMHPHLAFGGAKRGRERLPPEAAVDAATFLDDISALLETGAGLIATNASTLPPAAFLTALEAFVAIHRSFYGGVQNSCFLPRGGSERLSRALRSLIALALSRIKSNLIKKQLGVPLAEAIATNAFQESGENCGWEPSDSPGWVYVPPPPPPKPRAGIPPSLSFLDSMMSAELLLGGHDDDDSDDSSNDAAAAAHGAEQRLPAPRWKALKVDLARGGWGYVGHGEYGETFGVAIEDCL